MTLYLFDSDHIAVLQRETEPDFGRLIARVRRHPKSSFYLPIVGFHEQVLGAHTYINKARKREGVIRGYELMELVLTTFQMLPSFPFDEAAADVYESLRGSQRRIGTMDLRIASIAVAKQCSLLSRNVSDFAAVPRLTVEDWTAP